MTDPINDLNPTARSHFPCFHFRECCREGAVQRRLDVLQPRSHVVAARFALKLAGPAPRLAADEVHYARFEPLAHQAHHALIAYLLIPGKYTSDPKLGSDAAAIAIEV